MHSVVLGSQMPPLTVASHAQTSSRVTGASTPKSWSTSGVSSQTDCPTAGPQGKLTLKTTEMETMYDLGTKLIEALQVSPTRFCKGVSSCVALRTPLEWARETKPVMVCRSAHPALRDCTCCASTQITRLSLKDLALTLSAAECKVPGRGRHCH